MASHREYRRIHGPWLTTIVADQTRDVGYRVVVEPAPDWMSETPTLGAANYFGKNRSTHLVSKVGDAIMNMSAAVTNSKG